MSEQIKKKLCVVTTIAFTLEVFLVDQLVFLSRNGFDVTVICNYDDEFARTCPKELQYQPIPMDRYTSIWSTLIGMYAFYKFLRKNRFDMIQYCTPKAALIAAIVSWLLNIPVRLYCQWGIRYVGLQGFRRQMLKLFEKIVCRLSTHVSPDSYGNVDFSVSERLYAREKASVVSCGSANGVNLKRFDITKRNEWRAQICNQLQIPDSNFVFGWVGRVTKDKGLNELITAFLEVLNEDQDAQLIMVGAMEENNGLDIVVLNAIKQHPRIHYVGQQKMMELYFAAMDVLVVPSYREGFGSVSLEAQAMGIPVISTDIPGPREAIVDGKTGILVQVGEIAPLVASMRKLKREAALRKSMGEEGLCYVRKNFEQNEFWKKVLEHRKFLVGS